MNGAVTQFSKNRVLFINNDLRIEYVHGKLLFIDCTTEHAICVVNIERSAFLCFLSHISTTERLFRLEPRCVMRVSEDTFLVSSNGCLLRISIPSGKAEMDHRYTTGTKNPLNFCLYQRREKSEIVYGDYGGRDDKGRVCIYRRRDDEWSVIASFSPNAVRHIHRVEYDPFRDIYWIFTGDSDEASGIWRLSADSDIIEPYLVGKQLYRGCVAHITENTILYATDTPTEQNAIYRIEIDTKKLTKVCDMPGPCIYGCLVKLENGNKYCFSTSVEPDSRLPNWRYRTTYRLGAGIRDRYSYIIGIDDTGGSTVLHKAKKDWLPIWLFQFGNHRFPEQSVKDTLFTCPQSCVRKKKGTLRITL